MCEILMLRFRNFGGMRYTLMALIKRRNISDKLMSVYNYVQQSYFSLVLRKRWHTQCCHSSLGILLKDAYCIFQKNVKEEVLYLEGDRHNDSYWKKKTSPISPV